MIGTLRSIVDPSALGAVVAAAYRIDVAGCVLLRSLVNDVYRIDTANGPRILKLYRAERRAADVAWELELAAVLGGIVAAGIPLADGRQVGELAAPEGSRPYAMWAWAAGARPVPPFDDGLYRRYGAAAAWFHAAADAARQPSRPGRPDRVVDGDLAAVLDRLRREDRGPIGDLVTEARTRLSAMDLDRGICHGDLSLDNLHVDGDRIVLYDLDGAGTGPRAADLTGPAATPGWPAFLDGYRSVRSIADRDLAALPWLDVLGRLANLHFHLVRKPLLRGTESIAEGWAEREIAHLRAASARLR
jgi:Ser/Thr protein kinase RdoA (MazF antagonist)